MRRDRSVVKDTAGRIWLSLRRGISVVETARLISNSLPAIVHIESVSADGNPIDARPPLRIPPGRLRIRFDYLALSLSAPERVKYRYRLDGLDQDWSGPTSARDTVYMNLPPRSYRFRVIASNSAGSGIAPESGIGMEVVASVLEYVDVPCAGHRRLRADVSRDHRVRLSRLTERISIGFEERLNERTRIAQELHDTLLQGLLATSMHLHLTVDRLPDDSTVRPQLARVLTMLQQVV